MTILQKARHLRKNQTRAEWILWQKIRCRKLANFRFQRQVPIGNFIVDFMCYEAKIIIELDGGQHSEDVVKVYDVKRTSWLEEQGYQVLRFWNCDVLNQIEVVVDVIMRELVSSVRLG